MRNRKYNPVYQRAVDECLTSKSLQKTYLKCTPSTKTEISFYKQEGKAVESVDVYDVTYTTGAQ